MGSTGSGRTAEANTRSGRSSGEELFEAARAERLREAKREDGQPNRWRGDRSPGAARKWIQSLSILRIDSPTTMQFGSAEPNSATRRCSRPASADAGNCAKWPRRGEAAAQCAGATALHGGPLRERFRAISAVPIAAPPTMFCGGPESCVKPAAARWPARGRACRSLVVAADPPRGVASPATGGGAAGGRVSGACRTWAGWPW